MPRASRAKKQSEPQPNKVKRPSKRVKTTKVDDAASERDPEKLMGDRKRPKHWDLLSFEEKLEYIASRILAEDRHGITSHKALKETGILSNSQYERRRNREVYSQFGSLDEIKPTQGSFSRSHVRDLRGYKAVRDWERQQKQEAKAEKKAEKKEKKVAKAKAKAKKPVVKKATKKATTKKTVAKKETKKKR